MLKFLSVPLMAVLACGLTLSGCGQAGADNNSGQETSRSAADIKIKYVDAAGAQALLSDNPQIDILDIRTPEEIAAGHIDNAIFVNYFDKDFAQQLAKLDKKTPYLVHCRSGGRSTKALKTLKELGFTDITHLDGGFNGWMQGGFPVSRP